MASRPTSTRTAGGTETNGTLSGRELFAGPKLVARTVDFLTGRGKKLHEIAYVRFCGSSHDLNRCAVNRKCQGQAR